MRKQQRAKNTEKLKINQQTLGLKENREGIYVCEGGKEGAYPFYLPNESPIAEKMHL